MEEQFKALSLNENKEEYYNKAKSVYPDIKRKELEDMFEYFGGFEEYIKFRNSRKNMSFIYLDYKNEQGS